MNELFQVGRFYQHSAGRYIAIIAEVETYKWGRMFVVEETDKTGHSISCIQVGSEDTADNWIEVSKGEFMRVFKDPSKKVSLN